MGLARSIVKRVVQALAYRTCFVLGLAVSLAMTLASKIRFRRRGEDLVESIVELKNKLYNAELREKMLEEALSNKYLSSRRGLENEEFMKRIIELRLEILELEHQANSLTKNLGMEYESRNPLAELSYDLPKSVDSKIKFLLMKKHALETAFEKIRFWRWDS